MKVIPKLSIGIPTFNRPKNLENLLAMLKKQTFTNYELIISDNCSPSLETEYTVKNFQKDDNRIKFYKQKENMGPKFNYRFVLEQASADFFIWLADDDQVSSEEYLEKLYCEIEKGYDFVFPNIRKFYISSKGNKINMPDRGVKFSNSSNIFDNHYLLIKRSYLGYQLVSGIYRKDILLNNVDMWFQAQGYKNVSDEGPILHFLLSRYHWTFVNNIYYEKDMTKSMDFKNNLFTAFMPTVWHFFGVIGSIALSKYKSSEKVRFIIVYYFRCMFVLFSIGFYDIKKRLGFIQQ